MATLDAFEPALERAADAAGDLVVDLSELTFIDVAGMHALARAAERMSRTGRRLRVCHPSPQLRRLLRLVELGHLLA